MSVLIVESSASPSVNLWDSVGQGPVQIFSQTMEMRQETLTFGLNVILGTVTFPNVLSNGSYASGFINIRNLASGSVNVLMSLNIAGSANYFNPVVLAVGDNIINLDGLQVSGNSSNTVSLYMSRSGGANGQFTVRSQAQVSNSYQNMPTNAGWSVRADPGAVIITGN